MIESHPEEESWEGRRVRDLEEKKLFMLHSENQRLTAQQDSFQLVLADYAHKVDAFSEKTRSLEAEKERLNAEVVTLKEQCARVQDALTKRNEEYCNLYNYLFTENRSSLQDAFLKEIDLANRLSEIQHESDTQIIAKLKDNLKSKNEEVLRMARRISELNEALLSSGFDYEQKINALTRENERLKKVPVTILKEGNTQLGDAAEYCYKTKIESLNKQIESYRLELASRLNELSVLRSNNSQLQEKRMETEGQLHSIKTHMSAFDRNIYSLFSQNNKLKAELLRERTRAQEADRNTPDYPRDDDFQETFLRERETKEVARLRQQLQQERAFIDSLKEEQKGMLQGKLQAEHQLEVLKVVATSSIQKLKNFISTYVPYYYRKAGLQTYDLTKEEQEFIAQRNVEKSLQHAFAEVNNKSNEAKAAKKRLAQVEQAVSAHLHRIKLLEQKLANQEKDNAVLLNTLEELVEDKKRRRSVESGFGYEPYEDDELNRINEEEDLPAKEALKREQKIKADVLEQAVKDLQEDRTELINIIKSKEVMIAQLSAEINVLKTMSNVTTIQIQNFPIHPLNILQEDEAASQEEASTSVDLAEIREELKRLSAEYKQERESIVREYQQREAQNLTRYSTLLSHYEELDGKYRALEATISHSNPSPTDQKQPEQPPIDSTFDNHHHETHPRVDQPALSESAIENFTDTLKKYQREFNKFVGIYEAQMRKAIEGSIGSDNAPSEDSSMPDEHLDKLAALIAQHNNTVSTLQQLLAQKQQEADFLQAQLEEARNQLTQQTTHLASRLQEAEAAIASLRNQGLQEPIGTQFGSEEAANAAFLMLNAKNRELDSLRTAYEKLRKSYEERSKEAARLAELRGIESPMQAQEHRLVRQLLEEQDLLGVLSAATRHLE